MNPLLPGITSSRGLQGGFELGRVQVPPHPSTNRGSRVLQGRIWGSRVLQGRVPGPQKWDGNRGFEAANGDWAQGDRRQTNTRRCSRAQSRAQGQAHLRPLGPTVLMDVLRKAHVRRWGHRQIEDAAVLDFGGGLCSASGRRTAPQGAHGANARAKW